INAYYFGRWMGLLLTGVTGFLYWTAAWLAPPEAAWTAVVILMGQVGLPAFALGLVADRERRARAEVERLNEELKGTLSQLQAAQQELVVAERMATVGRLSLKVAHEVRNPIAAIGLNAEMLGDIMTGRPAREMEEAGSLLAAIREQVTALDALTEEYLAFARFPRPHFEEESVGGLVRELAEFIRPVATRQGLTVRVEVDPNVPMMEIDRGLLRQAALNLVKNGLEALSSGGELTIASHFDGDPGLRQSLERTLAREGYRVILASDGNAALERLQAGGVDLVLTDLKMPGLSGIELLRAVKAIASEVDVILLTAFGTVEEAVKAMKEGAYDFLTKPFQRAQLLRLIRQALERRDLIQQNRALQQRLDDLLHQ